MQTAGRARPTVARPRRCPRCPDTLLGPAFARWLIAVDTCPSCGGTWLGKGTLFLAADDPRAVTQRLAAARAEPSGVPSPASHAPRKRSRLADGVTVFQ